MNYSEEKTRIENEIKRLQSELETLEKRSQKEEWKKSLVDKFKEFLEIADFSEVSSVMVELGKVGGATKSRKTFYFSDFFNEPENTAKVETEPTAEPEKPENKIDETPEEKPVKMKMSLDELIKGME